MSGSGAATPPAVPPAWHDGLTGDVLGHIQNRGWDRLEPGPAAKTIYEAYRQAENRLGVPPEQLVRLPRDPADADGWKQVYQRLGAPADAADYAFDGVAFDDAETQTAFTEAMRGAAARNNLTKAQAQDIAKSVFEHLSTIGARQEADEGAKLTADRAALEQSWGKADTTQFKGNIFVANRAAEQVAEALGWDQPTFARLQSSLGDNPLLARLFHFLGSKMGEDAFITGGGPRGPGQRGVMTAEQASARYQELIRDKEWGKKMLANPSGPERRELLALIAINPALSGAR